MRRYFYILLLLLPLFACTREVSPLVLEELVDDAPKGTVSVTFSFTVPAEDPATKALGESSELETMHLAVFGSSGYYKKYVKAEKMRGPDQWTRTCGGVERTVDVYQFQAELELSNTARIIHFIGNGPSTIRVGNAKEVLPSELSGLWKTGFWQMVELPKIAAQTDIDDDGNEYYVADSDGDGVADGKYGEHPETDRYVISEETLKYFQYHLEGYDDDEKPIFSTESGIPLIRNWSKVCLKNVPGSHFTPISFAVVHVPKQGTLVPYGGITGFIPNYQDIAFDDLTDAEGLYAYKGNLPDKEDLFDETIPDASDFVSPSGRVRPYDHRYDPNQEGYDPGLPEEDEPAVYLYERPVPTDNMPPSFMIVYGTYLNLDDPIFFDSKIVDGWPARADYNPEADYSNHSSDHTEDGLSFDEFYNGIKCYYKVDFMTGGAYYPILRNFKYQVEIKKIEARGFNTPEDAAHSAGSADVSADVNASHLADISDGTRRMAIQPWMAKTFIKADDPSDKVPTHLFVKFFDDINAGDGGINIAEKRENADGELVDCVTWSFIDGDNGVIKEVSIDPPGEDSNNRDVYGWRAIHFRVQEPDMHVAKTQTLRIACMSYLRDGGELINPNEQPLYRDIVITLQPKQDMRVRCERESLPRQTKEAQKVTISIPDGLPRSMFPLEFIVEPENATLTASTDASTENLPVIYGKSIVPGNENKSAFQFKRTVTWDAYKEVQPEDVFQDESRWRSFDCHFITNCRDNETEVWVADKDKYFLAGNDNEESHDGFTNYSSFFTPVFLTSIPRDADPASANVRVQTGVYPENVGTDDYFFMEAVNLLPESADGADFEPVGDNLYKFVPTAETIVFNFKTQVDDGNVSLKFKSIDDSYVEASLAPWYFRNPSILSGYDHNSFSDVAYGHVWSATDKWFLVNCLTDTKNANPVISVKNLRGVKEDAGSFTSVGTYYEKWFQTETGLSVDPEPVSLTLSAVGYVEETVSAPRFNGEVYSWVMGNELKNLKDGATINKEVTQGTITGRFSLKISSTVEGKTPTASGNAIMLPAGGHYILNASITSSNTDVLLYYAQIHYQVSDGTPLKPYDTRVEPNPDGSLYTPYPGNNYVYMWTLPWGVTAGTLVIDAPANRDVIINKMILRGFHGILLDSPGSSGGDIGLGDNLNNGGML